MDYTKNKSRTKRDELAPEDHCLSSARKRLAARGTVSLHRKTASEMNMSKTARIGKHDFRSRSHCLSTPQKCLTKSYGEDSGRERARQVTVVSKCKTGTAWTATMHEQDGCFSIALLDAGKATLKGFVELFR